MKVFSGMYYGQERSSTKIMWSENVNFQKKNHPPYLIFCSLPKFSSRCSTAWAWVGPKILEFELGLGRENFMSFCLAWTRNISKRDLEPGLGWKYQLLVGLRAIFSTRADRCQKQLKQGLYSCKQIVFTSLNVLSPRHYLVYCYNSTEAWSAKKRVAFYNKNDRFDKIRKWLYFAGVMG